MPTPFCPVAGVVPNRIEDDVALRVKFLSGAQLRLSLRAAMLPAMLSDSWVQTLRGWCKQCSAIAEALERGDFRWSEDGRDVTLERAARYRERVSHFERLLAR